MTVSITTILLGILGTFSIFLIFMTILLILLRIQNFFKKSPPPLPDTRHPLDQDGF